MALFLQGGGHRDGTELRKPCQSQRCIRDVDWLCGVILGEGGAHRSFLCKLGADLCRSVPDCVQL